MRTALLGAGAVICAALALVVAAGDGGDANTVAGGNDGARPQGLALFASQACGTCHALAAAGSKGGLGPDLTTSLTGKSRAYVIESIVAPSASGTPGFSRGEMPEDYGGRMTRAEIETLADFLLASAN